MNVKRKFLFNGLLLTIVGFAMRGVGLFLGAYVAGAIGAEGIGLQGLISTVYAFAVTFATSGVSLSVTRLVAASIGKGGGGERVLRAAFIYAAIFGAASTVALLSLSDVIGRYVLLDLRVTGALRILSASLIPIALSGVISGYFVAVRRVTLNAAVQVAGQVMRILLTVAMLIRFADGDLERAMRALALSTAITEGVCFLLALIEYIFDRRMYSSLTEKGYAAREVAGMALPLAFSAYVRSFLMSVEHSLIPKRLVDRGNTRAEALSSYGYLSGMALPIILFPITPLSSFSGLLVPEFAECDSSGKSSRMEHIATKAASLTLVYAVAVAVFILAFSEELGYVIYDTYEAGRYIAFLAPVIPIMYLDHVTDSMLKGIGEHVFSMWVNIADAFLSVVLVWLLIPVLDVSGYALVIVLMELFNFCLSFMRLKKRVSFRLSLGRSLALPLSLSVFAVAITKRAFAFSGRGASGVWLVCEIVFAISLFCAMGMLVNICDELAHLRKDKGRKRLGATDGDIC